MESKSHDKGRFSPQKKVEAVLRLLRGEDLDTLSRELGVTAARLSDLSPLLFVSCSLPITGLLVRYLSVVPSLFHPQGGQLFFPIFSQIDPIARTPIY